MNKVYLYNNSFNSLFALISYLLKLNIIPKDIKSENEYIPNLLEEPILINIENEKEKIDELEKHLSLNIIKIVKYVYLADNKDKELIIYYFIKNALKYHNDILGRRNLNCVNASLVLSQYVSREAHKLKGFLRFKLTKNNFYYAEIAPSNNVISILANHFQKRLKQELWIIKDTKRNIYAVYDTKNVKYYKEDEIKVLNLEQDKYDEYEKLWLTFFNTIAIKERKNLKAQRNFMPKKYWQYIIEMDGNNERNNKR